MRLREIGLDEKMPPRWLIKADWARLEAGSPEERAGFAALGISAYGIWLTAGHDRLEQSVRETPYLSAYHFAEWLAWNWWRLRWEPQRNSPEWELSHAMASIGGGYVWPNIHIVSDGESLTLVCKPTPERARTSFRYINDSVSVVPAADFESEVDRFIVTVQRRLQDCRVADSNLHKVWAAVLQERRDPLLYRRRKLEALLGEEPDEMDEADFHRLLDSADATGQAALEEIAANRNRGQAVPDVAGLLELGHRQGTPTNPRARVVLRAELPHDLDAAWKLGTHAAQLLREQEGLASDSPVESDRLADMFGAPRDMLDPLPQQILRLDLSFALAESEQRSRVVLRSKWKSGRRFELARLLGDYLTCGASDPMRPATRSNTYRQKVQRAFAAEFLSPFQAVDAMLDGDYSAESQQDVAHHFGVSELTITTLLVNHGRIARSELGEPI